MNLRLPLLALVLGSAALPVLADEVKSTPPPARTDPAAGRCLYRQDRDRGERGFVDKGMVERLVWAEGDRSPADLVLTSTSPG